MRLFVALNLPPAVRQALWSAAAPVRDLGLPVKWVRPEGLHLTLKFLGEVDAAREAELRAALGRAAGGGAGRALALRLGGFGMFPDESRPRVLWVGVAPDPALELLQHRVELEFAPLGFPTEARAFRPHITLGRAARDARPGDFRSRNLGAALAALTFEETVLVETVDLMRSTLQSGGAVYDILHNERLS